MSNGTTTWTYTYDANGMRLKHTTGTNTLSSVAATVFAAAAIVV
jgi:YD repeat-containing protein